MNDIKKTFYLKDLDIVLATREFANFAIESAKTQNCKEISFQNIESVSRSFLDQLYILSHKNHINIVDIPQNIVPLLAIIEKSHQDQVLYAPKIKVQISNTTFA